MKDLNKELEKVKESPKYPMVSNTPDGWPSLDAMGDRAWYARALHYEHLTGHPVLPLGQHYDENWNIVDDEEEE